MDIGNISFLFNYNSWIIILIIVPFSLHGYLFEIVTCWIMVELY